MIITALKNGTYSYWTNDSIKIGRQAPRNEKRGGGLFWLDRNNETIANRVFFLNGMVKDGGAIYLHNCRNTTIKKCLFILNFAKWGGGIYLEKCSNISVVDNLFLLNFAVRDGGAISVSHSEKITLINNRFWSNLSFGSNPKIDLFKSADINITDAKRA